MEKQKFFIYPCMQSESIKEGWIISKIGDISDVISGFAFKSGDFANQGIPVVKIGNIRHGYIDIQNNVQFVDESFVKINSKYHLISGDILISLTGSNINQWNSVVGRVGLYRNNEFALLNQRAGKILVNFKKVNPAYLYYVLFSDDLRRSIALLGQGGANQCNISPSDVKGLEIVIPESLETQQKIASILSKYDDLIENNAKRIKILEQTAQEVYKEWFVKFKYPGHESVTMEDSGTDFGMIPEGWEVKRMLDIGQFRFVNENIKRFSGFKDYLATADIDGTEIVSEGERIDFESKPSRAQKQPTHNSVWFARMQNTFKVIGFSDANSDLTNSICLSSGMVGFDGKNEIFPFLYYTINSFDFHHKKDQYCTGATQRALTNDGLSEIKILIPKDDVISKFGDIFYISIQEILTLKKQNANLKQTRNLLLPKLISGELDVENLDIKI